MTLGEYLTKTYKVNSQFGNLVFIDVRPKIVCNDGFSMSVQASEYHYCVPEETLKNGNLYSAVEVGYPSEPEPSIFDYAEDNDYTKTVYGYVPVRLVSEIIKKHGGIKET